MNSRLFSSTLDEDTGKEPDFTTTQYLQGSATNYVNLQNKSTAINSPNREADLTQPLLIILRGAGGVGKSSVGDRLEEKIAESVHIDVDEFKVQAKNYLSNTQKRLAGRTVANLYLEDAMKQHKPIIISECFIDEYLDEVKLRASSKGYDAQTFYIASSLEDCLTRNRTRPKKLSDEHIINRYQSIRPNVEDTIIRNNPQKLDQAADSIIEQFSNYKVNAA